MKSLHLIAAAVLFASCASSSTVAPTSAAAPAGNHIAVSGLPPGDARFDSAALERLGGEAVPWTFRDEPHVYRGVRLDKVLAHCGFDAGPGGAAVPVRDRRPGWRKVVLASGIDGFVAVFTCAEVMPEMGPTQAFIVWEKDGVPLPADEGAFRLVVPTDHKGSRSVRQLESLRVTDAAAQ